MNRLFRSLFVIAALVTFSQSATRSAEAQRTEFTRMVAHWAEYGDPEYLSFIDEAKPDVAQIGFYGAHFWSIAHTPAYKGYPAHFPVQGLNECGLWFEKMNRSLHARNVKVVGHFNTKFLVGDLDGPEGPRGFFKFYRDLWNERELGKKPVADPLEFLEVDVNGKPIANNSYSIGGMKEYWACLNNPHWRTVLKAWVKRAVDRGVDGLIANYFYRHDCHCQHCQRGFRAYLSERYQSEQLKTQFAIDNLETHKFSEIVAWHKPDESTPLRREMLRYSQIANKRAFDEVLVEYGRSLKPGFIVAQWDHLSNFSAINGDERCLLPSDLWGKDEDYLWYSSGASAVYTDLKEGFLGDLTLQCRYIRGSFDDKPFTLGKYEHTRVRAAIAEMAANGGAPMGFYTRFTDPASREEIVRYYSYLHRYDELYRANTPHSEIVLLFPRSSIHQGNLEPLNRFRQLGRKLLDEHVLFDVIPDETITAEQRAKYLAVVDPNQVDSVDPSAWADISRFAVPQTVRVAASVPRGLDELTVHFVNYNRIEPPQPKSAGGGILDEKPIVARDLSADLVVPAGRKVVKIEWHTPETQMPKDLKFKQVKSRVQFVVPEALVYAVARVYFGK